MNLAVKGESSRLLQWLILFSGLIAGVFVYYPITDGDIFWHLAAGREIVSHKAFLFTDPFSFTTPGVRWIDLHWLFQVVVYVLFTLSGTPGLLLLKSVVIAVSVILLTVSVNGLKGRLLVALLFPLLIYQFRYLITMRPIIFSLLFFSLFIYCLERFCRTRSFYCLLILVPVQITWVNMQGLFPIGPIVYVLYMCGELINLVASKRYPEQFLYRSPLGKKEITAALVFFPVLLGCILINPYGFQVYDFSGLLLKRITPSLQNLYSGNIVENTPLLQMMLTADYSTYVYSFIAVTVLASMCMILNSRVRFAHLLLLGVFVVLAYMAQRNLILYAYAVIPGILWGVNYIRVPGKKKDILKRISGIATLLCIGVLMIALYTQVQLWDMARSFIAPFSHPVQSTEYLENNPVPGNIFNADRYGGYVVWKHYPEKQVFIDTRLSMRSPEFFGEYLAILDNPELFKQIASKFGITHVLIPCAHVKRYRKLARALYHDPNWNLVYTDGAEALFLRDSLNIAESISFQSPVTIDSMVVSILDRYKNGKSGSEALFHLANFLSGIGETGGAERVAANVGTLEGVLLMGRLRYLRGDSGGAIEILKSSDYSRNKKVIQMLESMGVRY